MIRSDLNKAFANCELLIRSVCRDGTRLVPRKHSRSHAPRDVFDWSISRPISPNSINYFDDSLVMAEHLLWMCTRGKFLAKQHNTEKAHRFLGFIHGALHARFGVPIEKLEANQASSEVQSRKPAVDRFLLARTIHGITYVVDVYKGEHVTYSKSFRRATRKARNLGYSVVVQKPRNAKAPADAVDARAGDPGRRPPRRSRSPAAGRGDRGAGQG